MLKTARCLKSWMSYMEIINSNDKKPVVVITRHRFLLLLDQRVAVGAMRGKAKLS